MANHKLFLNLPIANLARSVAFFTKLGFSFNPQFTSETSTSMIISEDAYVMLLEHAPFAGFAKLPVADPSKTTGGIYALSCDSRTQVDEMVNIALANGGSFAAELQDHGFMYGCSFRDPDGHHWEVFHMDPSFVQK